MNSNESAKQSATKTIKKNKAKFLFLGSLLLSLSLFFSFLSIPQRFSVASADEIVPFSAVLPPVDPGGIPGGSGNSEDGNIISGSTHTNSSLDRVTYYPYYISGYWSNDANNLFSKFLSTYRSLYQYQFRAFYYRDIYDGLKTYEDYIQDSISWYGSKSVFDGVNLRQQFIFLQLTHINNVHLSNDNLVYYGFAVYRTKTVVPLIYTEYELVYGGYYNASTSNVIGNLGGIISDQAHIDGTDIFWLYNMGKYLLSSSSSVYSLADLNIGGYSFLYLLFGGGFFVLATVFIIKKFLP